MSWATEITGAVLSFFTLVSFLQDRSCQRRNQESPQQWQRSERWDRRGKLSAPTPPTADSSGNARDIPFVLPLCTSREIVEAGAVSSFTVIVAVFSAVLPALSVDITLITVSPSRRLILSPMLAGCSLTVIVAAATPDVSSVASQVMVYSSPYLGSGGTGMVIAGDVLSIFISCDRTPELFLFLSMQQAHSLSPS